MWRINQQIVNLLDVSRTLLVLANISDFLFLLTDRMFDDGIFLKLTWDLGSHLVPVGSAK